MTNQKEALIEIIQRKFNELCYLADDDSQVRGLLSLLATHRRRGRARNLR
jgi:hypothetical protein